MAKLLNDAEDIVPSAAIQASTVRPKLVDYLALCQLSGHHHPALFSVFTSSISNAASMVSIRTVARIVPLGMPT